jgi:hypothetical protein
MVYWASHERRHHVWPVYGSSMCRPAPTEFLDFTSLTLEEFQTLVPPFEAAFQAHMSMWRLDGKPRTVRQFTVYKAYFQDTCKKMS